MLNDTYTIHDLHAAQMALHGATVSLGSTPLPVEIRVAEAIARARDEAAKGTLHLSELDRAEVRNHLYARVSSMETDASLARLAKGERSAELAARLEQHAARVRHLITLFAALCLLVAGCAQAHGRIEGPPLYVHLCGTMPPADQDAWGEAAGELNAELGEPVLWVGHGPPLGCNSVDVCPSSEVLAGAETRIGSCVITVRYRPGTAHEVAAQELELLLKQWGL